jgi:hypothetical protein
LSELDQTTMLQNKKHRSALQQPSPWAAACLVLLAACQGAPEQTQEQQQDQPEELRAMAAPPRAPAQYLTRQVKKCELDMMRSDFASFFKSGPSETALAAISPAQVDINWNKLDSLVDLTLSASGGTKRAVWVHYGIKAGNPPSTPDQVSYGFSVAELTDPSSDQVEWNVRDIAGHFFVLNAQGVLTDVTSINNWNDDEAYVARVQLRRASDVAVADAEKVQSGFDTRAYLMQWDDELVKLMTDNGNPPTIRFAAIAIQKELSNGIQYDLRDHVAAIAVDAQGNELVKNDPLVSGAPWRYRAADVGTPCPTICGPKVRFPTQGNELRTACP